MKQHNQNKQRIKFDFYLGLSQMWPTDRKPGTSCHAPICPPWQLL